MAPPHDDLFLTTFPSDSIWSIERSVLLTFETSAGHVFVFCCVHFGRVHKVEHHSVRSLRINVKVECRPLYELMIPSDWYSTCWVLYWSAENRNRNCYSLTCIHDYRLSFWTPGKLLTISMTYYKLFYSVRQMWKPAKHLRPKKWH